MSNVVWVVFSTNSYDQTDVEGVYSTKKKAESVVRFLTEDSYETDAYTFKSYELDRIKGGTKEEIMMRMDSLKQELDRMQELINVLEES